MKHHLSRVDQQSAFELQAPFGPAGDQPRAIDSLTSGIEQGASSQVLLGVTGSGKTYTIANVIARLNRPTLVMAHNKTLAAQLYSEFSEFFPSNAVSYFVSYYDYYQPEAYLPATDTYIEKDASINDEIDKLRHAATKSLLERRDVIVVASVSCIYGLGDPRHYFDMMLYLETGDRMQRKAILEKLVALQYQRNEVEFRTGTFRVRGDVVEVCPADESERSVRIEFFGDEIERLCEIDRITGRTLRTLDKCCIYPASHFVTQPDALEKAVESIREELLLRVPELERQGKTLEAQRLEQRTRYDMELMQEMGFCPGIENYSRHLTGRDEGEPPPTLIDYFDDDFITIIDESHVTVPQLGGMYRGDRSRKTTLVEHGFRLPSALDNRPLRFDELEQKFGSTIFVSATPAEYETSKSRGRVVEQIIRPTGLLDPAVQIRPAREQVEDFLGEVNQAVERGERVLATTLTKRMAEDLTEYYREVGVRVRYLHSDIDTLDRIDLIRGLRNGDFDLLVGINLLREGLDLPEVGLVGILDADKEGFLRSETSLIQTIGRAARHLNGRVILYADKETRSIKAAISETNRRRERQADFNKRHGIVPTPVRRAPEAVMVEHDELEGALADVELETPQDLQQTQQLIEELKNQMFAHAKALEFEQAAAIRDKISLLERYALSL